jgi:glycosyltransferase involved in cell wall biosynthesis
VNLLLFPKSLAVAQTVRALEIDHIHASWLTTPATIGYVASLLTGIPFSMSAHSHDIRARNLLESKAAQAAFVRVISERNRRYVAERMSADSARRCRVVHLGVDVPAGAARPPARVARILCSARLVDVKGHRYLVDALALLQARGVAFECDFAGDGELRAEIAQQIARLGLEHCVHLLGAVDHDRLTASLAAGAYDLSVLASVERPQEHEGIPVALMEAMAAAIPVVATQTGSIEELVGADAGTLVPQRDAAALASALERLISDPRERHRLGDGARAAVLGAFDNSQPTRELAALMGVRASERAAVPPQVA